MRGYPKLFAVATIPVGIIALSWPAHGAGLDTAGARPSMAGVAAPSAPSATAWVLPETPSGFRPNQSWFSIGGTPDGTMLVTASDHRTNSVLYSLPPAAAAPGYRGDARAASLAADNWLPGETAEKFHVRPLVYRGNAYLATADYSNQDQGYLKRRGFHWYRYDLRTQKFVDLSAKEPGGVAAAHISIFATALDERRGLIYGLGSPTAHLYQYDIAKGVTKDLGRPPELTREFYGPGRLMWVDSRGRVYFTVESAGKPGPGEPPAPPYVLSWDPSVGWSSRPDWPVAEMLRTGQWSLDGDRFYALDYQLRLYVFDDSARTFTALGQGRVDASHVSARTKGVHVRSMNLSANEQKIYFVNDTAPTNSLFEWDFRRTMVPRELTTVAGLDSRLDARYAVFTGHDSWDLKGRFSFTGFGGEGASVTPNVFLIRVDPVRTKAALGLLPGVAVVGVKKSPTMLTLTRTGDLSSNLTVILRVRAGKAAPDRLERVVLPAGTAALPLPALAGADVTPVADGDTYVIAP